MKDIIEKIDVLVESPVYGIEKGKKYLEFKKDVDNAKDKKALTLLMTSIEKSLKNKIISNKEMVDLIDRIDKKAIKFEK